MKKIIILAVLLFSAGIVANAQTNNVLGVGITVPVGTLHVHNSQIIHGEIPPMSPDGDDPRLDPLPGDHSESTIHLTNAITGTNLSDGFLIDYYDSLLTLQQLESGSMILKNHGAEIILSSGGKVGIGAVSSSHLFNVNGTARVMGLLSAGSGISCTGYLSASSGSFSSTLTVGTGFSCTAAGVLKVKSLRVTTTDWPDYVFGGGHRLMPLQEVEDYINVHGHLPEVPSAEEAEANGVDLGEMNKLLLQKVEELTLYVIELQKQLEELKSNKYNNNKI